MKNKILMAISILLLSLSFNVNAESFYYVNSNGVGFTEEQYNYITKMYWNGYHEYITQEDLDYIDSLDVYNGNYERKIDIIGANSKMTRNSMYEKGRTFVMTKSCGASQCHVVLGATWSGSPTVTSYDVIGARIANGASIKGINTATVTATGYSQTYSTPKTLSNGFGYSVDLPSSGTPIISTSLTTYLGGTIYGTYQHAMSNISLTNSQNYTLSNSGYGHVFSFTGVAASTYDQANGLNFSLS